MNFNAVYGSIPVETDSFSKLYEGSNINSNKQKFPYKLALLFSSLLVATSLVVTSMNRHQSLTKDPAQFISSNGDSILSPSTIIPVSSPTTMIFPTTSTLGTDSTLVITTPTTVTSTTSTSETTSTIDISQSTTVDLINSPITDSSSSFPATPTMSTTTIVTSPTTTVTSIISTPTISTSTATTTTLTSSPTTTTTSSTSTKPNIIFILADDLGWNSIGSEDFDISFATETLSSLASSGLTMANYYAQEVCTPARGSLLTGRVPLSIGMQYFMVETAIPWGMTLNETTLPEVLSNNGYDTYMLGKWHLGHYSPRYIPTARGFDSFIGMLNGESYYWSKRNPDHPHFKDFIVTDRECYYPYDDDDIHDYSTHMYRDLAIDLIENHDLINPFFLYLSFQAVHDPFDDVKDVHENGIPKEYLEDDIYQTILSTVKGKKRQQFTMSLNIMDQAVKDIVTALETRGIMDNTYLIFSSDNGGCYGGGGKNGPLRGTKGSLFEGGTKVDAFVYSPLLPTSLMGSTYLGLFHISDWFPTILDLSNINYSPSSGYELDGVSHVKAWYGETDTAPRTSMLYNYYANVDFYTFNMWINGSFAIRDTQYKLMHTFNSSTYAAWYSTTDEEDDDDALDSDTRCAPQAFFGDGDFTYFLFDLVSDPYETTNLYDSEEPSIITAKENLYKLLPDYYAKSTEITASLRGNQKAFQIWKDHDDFIVPYVKEEDLAGVISSKTFPSDCYSEEDESIRKRKLISSSYDYISPSSSSSFSNQQLISQKKNRKLSLLNMKQKYDEHSNK